MRYCVLALAPLAFAQPAFAHAHSHKHAHHAHRHVHYRVAHMPRMQVESGYAMPQAFMRTNATDLPFFSDPSFQNRSWRENTWNQNAASNAAPSFGFNEQAQPRVGRHARVRDGALDALIARHAAANGLPLSLVHRVVKRESGYNPRASSRGNIGLMQIRYATARGVGYTGSAAGLLDAETNLTYAVRYLAGAYRAAGGNASRAVSYYASGYHGRGAARAMTVRHARL